MEKRMSIGKQWFIRATLLLICLAILLTGLAFLTERTASAEGCEQVIVVSDATVHRGQEFDVDISITNNDAGLNALRLVITFDTSAMRLISYTAKNPDGSTKNGWIKEIKAANTDSAGGYGSYGGSEKPFVLLWDCNDKLFGDGKIVTLTFASKETAAVDYERKYTDYSVNVEVDERNTLIEPNQTCDPEVTGGRVRMLYGFYSVTLLDDEGNYYNGKDTNNEDVMLSISLDDLVAEMGGYPQRVGGDTQKYTYVFDHWRETAASTETARIYSPVYRAEPNPFPITFHHGLVAEGETEVEYYEDLEPGDEDPLADIIGAFEYRTQRISLPYGSSIPYEFYMPSNTAEYTFYGWYSDAACTTPVNFATMPSEARDVYGCYRYNADPADLANVGLEITLERNGEYVDTTLRVTENHIGFNSLRFALDYDDAKLEFVAFRYDSTSPFFGEFEAVFPVINDAIEAGETDLFDIWQAPKEGVTLDGKYFLFYNGSRNTVLTEGDLITFRFKVKDTTLTTEEPLGIGVTVGEKDATRFMGEGRDWYTNVKTAAAELSVVRVTKPTSTEGYVYTGETQNLLLANDGDSAYYTVTGAQGKNAGDYVVTVALAAEEGKYITWADGSTDDLALEFTIDKKSVAVPDENVTGFVFNKNDQSYGIDATSDYTVTDGVKRNVGSYTVVVSLRDTDNTEWEGGSIVDIEYPFVILPLAIQKPQQDDTVVYWDDGNELHYAVVATSDYTVTGGVQTTAGAHSVTIALTDKANTVWEDEPAETATDDLEHTFNVLKKQIAAPVATEATYVYNGEEQTFPLSGSDYYTVNNNVKTDAGEYVVTVTLNDADNTAWADGAVTSFDFVIEKAIINPPTFDPKDYTGETVKATFIIPANAPYYCAENEGGIAVTDEGYPVVFKITNEEQYTKNYRWETPDDGDPLACTKKFYIRISSNRWEETPSITSRDYNGKPIEQGTVARAKIGDVVVTYRVRGTSEALSGAPVDSGDYVARFEVVGTDNYDALSREIYFSIYQVKLTIPTAKNKTYTYNGAEQSFEFENPGNGEQYIVEYGTRKDAGSQTVYLSLRDPKNYVWLKADETTSVDRLSYPFEIGKLAVKAPTETTKTYIYNEDAESQTYEFGTDGDALYYDVEGRYRTNAGTQTVTVTLKDTRNMVWANKSGAAATAAITFDFTIEKKTLVIPTSANKQYIYNGKEQTFEFDKKGDTGRYYVTGDKRTEVGAYSVYAFITDGENYQWEDGTGEEKSYPFEIRFAEITAVTAAGEYAIKITSEHGFSASTALTILKTSPNVPLLLEDIASYDKYGALNQLARSEAAALVEGKCIIASFHLSPYDTPYGATYTCEITLPSAMSDLVIVRMLSDDERVDVYETIVGGERVIRFVSTYIEDFLLLGDHLFDKEVATETYLKSEATCEDAAIYYKSCSCGASAADFTGETFTYGEALGHNYDFANIRWQWSEDHFSCTARVVCRRVESHVAVFDAQIDTLEYLAPTALETGRVRRVASFTYGAVTYSTEFEELLPATGYTYSGDPVWSWRTGKTEVFATAIFTSDDGEHTAEVEATVRFLGSSNGTLGYAATAVFNGKRYETESEENYYLPAPTATFDFNDGVTQEVSREYLPGQKVVFIDAPARAEEFVFIGWRSAAGTLIVKNDEGAFIDYTIGFDAVVFTAEWKSVSTVTVQVEAAENVEITTIELYESIFKADGEESLTKADYTIHADEENNFVVEKVPFGNYKIVVYYKVGETPVSISNGLDVAEAYVRKTIVIGQNKLNTAVEGVGAAEGLEDAISASEKAEMDDSTEITITQVRVSEVEESVKREMKNALTDEAEDFVEFYDVTLHKQVTIHTTGGDRVYPSELISEADGYQTNIFPISAALRIKLAEVGGTVDNIFVYRRHVSGESVEILRLPKVTAAEGASADKECFYIKVVAGEEYIAVRQRYYSTIAFGISSTPVYFTNEITDLYFPNWTFDGSAQSEQKVRVDALHDVDRVTFTYAADLNGTPGAFSQEKPTNAGTYWIKAYIPANNESKYAAAERIFSFSVYKKQIAKPVADDTAFVYNGSEQIYDLAVNADYEIAGNCKTDAGNYSVIVSLKDVENTVWVGGGTDDLAFDFVIAKKKITDYSEIKFEDKNYWFNGKKRSIEISGDLPEGVEVVYSGNGEYELGKYVVTATFLVNNPNYEMAEPMTAVMHIRLNWVPIVVLIVIVLAILLIVIVVVEKLLKKQKKQGEPPAGQGQNDAVKEGTNND